MDSIYRVGLISKRGDLSIFQSPSSLGWRNEIRFAIDSKTKIESDFSNRNANENENDCVDSFLSTGSAHGPTRQMGT
jgi:hypothetical protein